MKTPSKKEFKLKYCPVHSQMTNHQGKKCLKCAKEIKDLEDYNNYVNNAKMIYYEQNPTRIPDAELEFILRIAWNSLKEKK